MNVDIINADVRLRRNPRNGVEAHRILVESLMAEIKEKQTVLDELQDEDIKRKFIRQWIPDTRNINIYDVV